MWKELHIQSNLPLIIMSVSFICILIIGFLEYRKISIRIDKLVEKVNQLEVDREQVKIPELNNEELIQDEEVFEEKKEKKIKKEKKVKQENDEEIKEDPIIDEGFQMNNTIQMEGNIPMDGIPMDGNIPMDGIPMDGIPMDGGIIMGMPNIASIIMGGGPPPGMMQQMDNDPGPTVYEEDIEEKKADIVEENEDQYSESGSEKSLGSEKSFDSEEGTCSESETESETEDEQEIQGKGKVEEVVEKTIVDRSFSIKELKNICQELNISASGNKEQLIQRINNKK